MTPCSKVKVKCSLCERKCLVLLADAAVGRGNTSTVSLLGDPTHFLLTEEGAALIRFKVCGNHDN